MMWIVLASYGIPDKLLHIIQSMYSETIMKVLHRDFLGRDIHASGVINMAAYTIFRLGYMEDRCGTGWTSMRKYPHEKLGEPLGPKNSLSRIDK